MLCEDLLLDGGPQCGLSSRFLAFEERLKELLVGHEHRIVDAVVQRVHPLVSGKLPVEQPACDLGSCDARTTRASTTSLHSSFPESTVWQEAGGGVSDSHPSCAGLGADGQPAVRSGMRLAVSTDELQNSSLAASQPRGLVQSGLPSRKSNRRNSWVDEARPSIVELEQRTSQEIMMKYPLNSSTTLSLGELEQTAKNFAVRLIAKSWFVTVIASLTLANVAVVGVQADFSVRNVAADMPGWLQALDVFFAVAFTLELSLRICAERAMAYSRHNPNLNWNLLDTLLVVTALIEEVLKKAWDEAPDMSAMRALRMLRFVRLARVVRVARMFSDLRIMVAGILNSAKSLMWAMVLLFLFAFMFGVFVLEIVSVELYNMDTHPDQYSQDVQMEQTLRAHWGSLLTACYTLFLSICGGIDWGDVANPLIQISPVFGALFCAYIALAVFCVLNIVTGVFVENTKSMSSKDETQLVMETMDERKKFLEEVKTLWSKLEIKEGVSLEHFTERVEDVRVQSLFRKLGLDVTPDNARGLFKLLDFDESGTIEVDEFAAGIRTLHGQAKSIDMARTHHVLRNLQRQMEDVLEHLATKPCQGGPHMLETPSAASVRPPLVSAPVPPLSLPGCLEEPDQ